MSKAPTLEQALAAAEVLRDYTQEESSWYTWGCGDRKDSEAAYQRRIETQAILDVLRKRKAENDAKVAAERAATASKVTTLGDLMMEDMAANEAAWNSPAAVAARAAEIDAARAARAASKVKRPRK